MSGAMITVDFVVPVGCVPGDYAVLYGNGGSGDIDWDTPVSDQKYELFPNGGGIYGFGCAPFGSVPFGQAYSTRCPGFGNLPFGRGPFGYGSAWIKAKLKVTQCGDYKFGFELFDKAGNENEGTPGEVTTVVHIAPGAPLSLSKTSYNKSTGNLVLAVT